MVTIERSQFMNENSVSEKNPSVILVTGQLGKSDAIGCTRLCSEVFR